MRVAAGAGIPDAHLTGICLGIGEELAERLPRGIVAHRDCRCLDAYPRHGIEGFEVEGHDPGMIIRRYGVRVPDDRIPVRFLLLDVAIADCAAAAGPV